MRCALYHRWPLNFLATLVVTLCALPTSPAWTLEQWRMERHDVANSRFSPGTAKLTTPVARFRARVGGGATALAAIDVSLNGTDDLVAIEAGSVSARAWSGTTLWKTAPFGATALVGIADVTGDALPEVVTRSARQVVVLSLLSGAVVWSSKTGEFDELTYVELIDLDGDGRREIAMANAGGNTSALSGETHLIRLYDGPKNLCVTAKQDPYGSPISAGTQVVGDVDGDGALELVSPMPGGNGQWWLSTQSLGTCQPQAKSDKLVGGGVPRCAVPRPGVLICADAAATAGELENISRYKRAGDQISPMWTIQPTAQTQPRLLLVDDLDGDQQQEVLLWQPKAGLQVVDLQTGEELSAPWWDAALGAKDNDVEVSLAQLAQQRLLFARAVGFDSSLSAVTGALSWSRGVGFVTRGKVAGALRVPSGARGPDGLTLQQLDASGANAVTEVDTDGDGLTDQQRSLALSFGDGKLTTASIGSVPHDPLGTASLSLREGGQWRLGKSARDGHVTVYSVAGDLLNDANGDQRGDLSYSGVINARLRAGQIDGAAPALLVGLAGRLLSFRLGDAAGGGAPQGKLLLSSGVAPMLGVPLMSQGKTPALLTAYRPPGKGAHLRASQGDKVLWTWSASSPDLYLANKLGPVLKLLPTADGEDVLLGLSQTGNSNLGGFRRINGATGDNVWPVEAAAAGSNAGVRTFALTEVNGALRIVLSLFTNRVHYDAASGDLAYKSEGVKEPRYGIPRPTQGQLLVASASNGHGLETITGSANIWKRDGKDWWRMPAALASFSGKRWLATLKKGSTEVELIDVDDGKTLWTQNYAGGKAGETDASSLRSVVGVRDLDGDGVADALLTSSTGWLYAISLADGAIHWALDYGGDLGDPIVADLDADGQVEIALVTPDGYVEVIDQQTVPPVAWVREHGEAGPALSEGEDIDSQESSTTARVNWAAVAEAQSYSVRLVTSEGVALTAWSPPTSDTALTLSGLSLQVGVKYVSEVRAGGTVDGEFSLSQVTQSDGFEVIDQSPPSLDSLSVTPSPLAADHAGATFVVEATDLTRLRTLTCELKAGGEALWTETRSLNLPKVEVQMTWDGQSSSGELAPPGLYAVTCVITDVGGLTASMTREFTICPGEPQNGACVEQGQTGGVIGGTQVDPGGCGCQVRGRGADVTAGMLLLLALVLSVLTSRRQGGRVHRRGEEVDPDEPLR